MDPTKLNTTLTIIIVVAFILILIIAVVRARNDASVSKPDIIDHPSAFKKPEIEMSSSPSIKPGPGDPGKPDNDKK